MPALEMITLWPPEKNIGVWAILLFERQKAYKVLFPEGYPKKRRGRFRKASDQRDGLGPIGEFLLENHVEPSRIWPERGRGRPRKSEISN